MRRGHLCVRTDLPTTWLVVSMAEHRDAMPLSMAAERRARRRRQLERLSRDAQESFELPPGLQRSSGVGVRLPAESQCRSSDVGVRLPVVSRNRCRRGRVRASDMRFLPVSKMNAMISLNVEKSLSAILLDRAGRPLDPETQMNAMTTLNRPVGALHDLAPCSALPGSLFDAGVGAGGLRRARPGARAEAASSTRPAGETEAASSARLASGAEAASGARPDDGAEAASSARLAGGAEAASGARSDTEAEAASRAG